jgi:hypothetical protein
MLRAFARLPFRLQAVAHRMEQVDHETVADLVPEPLEFVRAGEELSDAMQLKAISGPS